MKRILIMYSNQPPGKKHIQNLQKIAKGWDIQVANDEQSAIAAAPETDIILGHRYLYQCLQYTSDINWIQSTAAGVAHLITPQLISQKPILTRCPIFSNVIAFHALALAMSMNRDIPNTIASQKKHQWQKPEALNVQALPKTAMVIGMGMIGQQIACLLRKLGIYVYGVINQSKPAADSYDMMLEANNWHSYLNQVDWCFLALPETPQNHQFFDREAIYLLKTNALLVNVGHSSTLDHNALFERLKNSELAGAALDVFDKMPLLQEDPVWKIPRLLITPHISIFTPERQDVLEQFIEGQLKRYLSGEELDYEVTYNKNL